MFDAAIEGFGAYDRYAYFFQGPSYVRYDWQSGRASDGFPKPLSEWNLPAPFNEGITGALAGAGAYRGIAYFFRGTQWVAYHWDTGRCDPPQFNTAWNLPPGYVAGFDAAWSGEGNRANKAYFLKGQEYLRYDWATNRIDPQYPKPLAERRITGMSGGVDAALNGRLSYQGYAYFFAADDYARLDWKTLFGDSARLGVARNWPGLAEITAAASAARLALRWITAARTALTLLGSGWPSPDPVLTAALAAHFQIRGATDAARHLPSIRTTFDRLHGRLETIGDVLRYRTDLEATGLDGTRDVPPAYAMGAIVNLTGEFLRWSDTGQVTSPEYHAASLMHEGGHSIGLADHAYEWENPATDDPTTAHRYDSLTPALARENTSSYVAFAQHVHERTDVRWGAGDPEAPHR